MQAPPVPPPIQDHAPDFASRVRLIVSAGHAGPHGASLAINPHGVPFPDLESNLPYIETPARLSRSIASAAAAPSRGNDTRGYIGLRRCPISANLRCCADAGRSDS